MADGFVRYFSVSFSGINFSVHGNLISLLKCTFIYLAFTILEANEAFSGRNWLLMAGMGALFAG